MRSRAARARDEFAMLVAEHLARSPQPVGSLALADRLAERGVPSSPATVGRVLASLDRGGLTRRVSNKGRELTDEGRRWLKEQHENRVATQWGDRLLRSVGRTTLEELRDALLARRALEREAARLAAESASAEQLSQLEEVVDRHRDELSGGGNGAGPAKDFHVVLADICGNLYIAAALHLIRTATRGVEELMFELGASIGGECYPTHRRILQALRNHEPSLARDLAARHLEEYIAHIERWTTVLGNGDGVAGLSSANGFAHGK